MNTLHKYHFSGALLLLLCQQLMAQSTINTAATHATLNNQYHSWSVGEMCLISTAATGSLTVTQGFLQPSFGTVSTNDTADKFFNQLSVFPNPVSSILHIEGVSTEQMKAVQFEIYNASGALLSNISQAIIPQGQWSQTIDLQTYPSGAYLLVIKKLNQSSTFTITKI